MDRENFLKELERNLSGLDKREKDSIISFYVDYFNEQMAQGRTEQDIIDELGDPRLLAKSIRESNKESGKSFSKDEDDGFNNHERRTYKNVTVNLNSWYTKLIAIVIGILAILLIGALITGILAVFLKIVIPVVIILIIVSVLENIFRR